ncbi:hypothetical protein [Trinickia mobilis]|uniref:hypothetical protein n=1 Tax=Trinickia mobilis TaxID=2816356 RepID=UPI001F5DF6E7|nr:hypothetical protein [Trinickia mobilis]
MNPTHTSPLNAKVGPADASTTQSDQQSAAVPQGKRPQRIFLHTGWRSGGTWVWSRFRALESVSALYEPLGALLGELSLDDIPDFRPDYTSGHPPLRSPYYEEYRPFVQKTGRGVNGYRKNFGIDRFGDAAGDDFPALCSYLKNLCDFSTGNGKVPVLKFCRSQGRTPWLKRAFPDVMHAGILRNPASQFASGWMLRQEWRNPFFVAAPFRVLGLNQGEPIVRQVIAMCGVKVPPVETASEEAYTVACTRYAQTAEGVEAYRAFVALWILCAWRMLNDVDLLLDTDRLGQSPAYAAGLRSEFQAATGVAPDFSAARNLVDEATRNVRRMSEIDGRLLRPINFSARKFLLAQIEASGGSQSPIAEIVRQKLSLADEISGQWRY